MPSLSALNLFCNFSITIYSSSEVELKKLNDAKYVVVSGKWTDKTAGGCHLYSDPYEKGESQTWKRNPKYQLIMRGSGKFSVKITISRPEKSWSHKVAKSPVSCMIGFYVFAYTSNSSDINKEKVLNKVVFVPMNEQSETMILDGDAQSYIVMPATYEKNMVGPYIFGVTADDEFEFKEMALY